MKAIILFHDEEEILRSGYLQRHHTATARGYNHKGNEYVEEYSGRFGRGYIFHHASSKSNNYHDITYYVED